MGYNYSSFKEKLIKVDSLQRIDTYGDNTVNVQSNSNDVYRPSIYVIPELLYVFPLPRDIVYMYNIVIYFVLGTMY